MDSPAVLKLFVNYLRISAAMESSGGEISDRLRMIGVKQCFCSYRGYSTSHNQMIVKT